MTTRRNVGVAGATVVTVGSLLLFPTSRGAGQVRVGQAAASAGIVAAPSRSARSTAARSSAARSSAAPVSSVVVNGTSVDTQYGPVQVQLTVRDGTIVKAVAIEYPQGGARTEEISSFAIPVLKQETVRAQSAQIDTVSGATYTSAGYRQSLQAALDAAHL